RLVQNIRSYGNHLTTGFLGTPYLCDVLTRFGYPDVAYTLLMQESYPSWLYPVKMGATTIWERWNGIRPDSTFEPASMNSFNHYAYGAIGDWMYSTIAGINAFDDTPGYKLSFIQPRIGGGLSFASASLQTVYGKLSSGWKVEADQILYDVEIPPNTSAVLILPLTNAEDLTENGRIIQINVSERQTGGRPELRLGSGVYHFVVKKKPK
ncbi:MAG TPA: alpha-L-rhamnosidase C-terminal domain-containing protein, partial [Chitinophagaceae bacterium]|nr:alpha-L-rhamnosidase C-terminal domain-containing protein [Chitinophagaceae bacterium]